VIHLAIAIGGALGAFARHGAGAWLAAEGAPLLAGTFAVNIVGSLLLGLLVGWLAMTRIPLSVRSGLTVGLCGGFTTFSTFAYESVLLLQLGHRVEPLGYIAATLTLGPIAMLAGLWVSGAFPPPARDGGGAS
jgi:fluoride exporter